MSKPGSQRGGSGSRAFLAFKLHRFISGAGNVYANLLSYGNRRVTLDGQRFDPESPEARLYPLFFCRSCGQEFHTVTLVIEGEGEVALPRPIDETPLDSETPDHRAGYLVPFSEDDNEFQFAGNPEDYPEEWRESRGGVERLRNDRKDYLVWVASLTPKQRQISMGLALRIAH